MSWVLRYFYLTLLLLSTTAQGGDIGSIYEQAAIKHGLAPTLLSTIGAIESSHSPYALNVDEESFWPDTPAGALAVLSTIQAKPWVAHIHTPDNTGSLIATRAFFPTRGEALSWMAAVNESRLAWGHTVTQRSDSKGGAPHSDIATLRKIDLANTGLGLMQINYRYHGFKADYERWLDPHFNAEYAASYLRSLIDEHGSVEAAVRYYCCGGKGDFQKVYLQRFRSAFPGAPS